MIKAEHLSKAFGEIKAVDNIDIEIPDNSIFGLAGTNGAGKSTFLRLLSGVLKPDQGSIMIDEKPVYEQEEIKREIFFLPDSAYFIPNATGRSMADWYAVYYPKFDRKRFDELAKKLDLDTGRKIHTLSKGMKRQVSMLLGVCAGTKYLFCDETFDGLDPVMRQAAKSILAYEVTEREFTPVIASHNLRELEDICDHVGLLHKGGVLLSREVEDMKLHIHKIQCVIQNPVLEEELLRELEVIQHEKRLSLMTLIVRGEKDRIMEIVESKFPVFAEMIPLTLEEIFISETEVAGYDIKDLFY